MANTTTTTTAKTVNLTPTIDRIGKIVARLSHVRLMAYAPAIIKRASVDGQTLTKADLVVAIKAAYDNKTITTRDGVTFYSPAAWAAKVTKDKVRAAGRKAEGREMIDALIGLDDLI